MSMHGGDIEGLRRLVDQWPSGAIWKFCRCRELAKALGVNERTIYRWIENGQIPKPQYRGRFPLWRLAELQELLTNGVLEKGHYNPVPPPPPPVVAKTLAAKRRKVAKRKSGEKVATRSPSRRSKKGGGK